MSGGNRDGPGRFRTKADNPEFQVCYFNSKNNKQVYNEFISQRINNYKNENDFHFKIVRQRVRQTKSSEELDNLKETYTNAKYNCKNRHKT